MDTEANRNAMKDADFSQWTTTEKVAEMIKNWVETEEYPKEIFYKV